MAIPIYMCAVAFHQATAPLYGNYDCVAMLAEGFGGILLNLWPHVGFEAALWFTGGLAREIIAIHVRLARIEFATFSL